MIIITSCETDYSDISYFVEKKIVVDGWIENEKYPIVILTYNTPYFSNLDSATFRDLIATRAKVTVSDGETSEILILTRDPNYFPPYVYKGKKIKGVIGKKYYLEVIEGNDTIKATTTIPSPPVIEKVRYEPKTDTSGILCITLKDNEFEENFYRFFTMLWNKENRFIPTLVAGFSDKMFNGKQFTFFLNKGPSSYLKPVETIYFAKGDTIIFKATCVDKASFDFWSGYDKEIFDAGNPFAANYRQLNSNVLNGLGIWCGYACVYFRIVAE